MARYAVDRLGRCQNWPGRSRPTSQSSHYDRRGRGECGDASSHAVEREVEDIEAVADAAGTNAAKLPTLSAPAANQATRGDNFFMLPLPYVRTERELTTPDGPKQWAVWRSAIDSAQARA